MSSDGFHSVLVLCRGGELFVPHFSSVGVFLRLRLAHLLQVELGCLPDRHVELSWRRKKEESQGRRSHRKGRGHPDLG